MEMVGEHDEGRDPPRAPLHGPRQAGQEPVAVVIVARDVLSAVPAGHEMVDGVVILDSESARHGPHWSIPIAVKQGKGGKKRDVAHFELALWPATRSIMR